MTLIPITVGPRFAAHPAFATRAVRPSRKHEAPVHEAARPIPMSGGKLHYARPNRRGGCAARRAPAAEGAADAPTASRSAAPDRDADRRRAGSVMPITSDGARGVR